MKKILIKTYGCSFNQSDSEIMAGLLAKSGRYSITDSEKDASLVIINSCTVKNNAETKFWRDVREIKKPKILAGCVPQAEQDKVKFDGFSVVGTNNITDIVHAVDVTLSGNTIHLIENKHLSRVNIPKIRRSSIIEIIPINEGCLGNCDFCKTIFARGRLESYPLEDIVRHARNALNDGAKELWLTSQDTGCYGFDIDTNIVELLSAILEMKRDFRIRLGMANPDYLGKYLAKLMKVYEDKRMFKFIHIPVQSGSDDVLKKMKRKYDSATFINLVESIRKMHPDMTISTDLIVGHPDETDKDFEMSMQLLKKVKPDVVNLSRFWARPGTVAAKKKPLRTETVKERGIIATKLCHKILIESNKRWLSWQGEIIIDEIGKNNTVVGRNYAYRPVILKERLKIGEIVKVKIEKTTTHDLRGEKI